MMGGWDKPNLIAPMVAFGTEGIVLEQWALDVGPIYWMLVRHAL